MKRARVRWLISYRIYRKGSGRLLHQGWGTFSHCDYGKCSKGLINNYSALQLSEHGLSDKSHYLEIVSISKI